MDNEITVPDGMKKKEWFTVKEFREGVKAKRSSFNAWLKNHPDFIEKYCQNIGHGNKKPRYRILWKGVAAYVSQYSQTQRKSRSLRLISEAKERSTEIVNKTIESGVSQKTMTPEMMLLETARLLSHLTSRIDNAAIAFQADHARIESIEEKVDAIKNKMDEPLPVTSLHRQFLGDRVKLYAIKQEIEFPYVWRKVNQHVGRGGVDFYDFSDFQKALKFLKSLYEQAGMDWGE